ncbi:dihydrodiol dehydrogenase [Mycobacterium sp. MBM]|nr:dihydrodiol dehydrogenase [Mycobacterium sp. MBM]
MSAGKRTPAEELQEFKAHAVGETLTIANEFAEVQITKVNTRNGARLLVEAPKSAQWVTLDPLELEALTWQNKRTLSAMVGTPFAPLIPDEAPE